VTIQPAALPHTLSIPPYQAGKPIEALAREIGMEPGSIIKLASNENPMGMSSLAQDALMNFAGDRARYPDPDCYDLRHALSASLGVPTESIIVGPGSSELIVLAARAFLGEERSAVIPQYSFAVYSSATRATAARSNVVPASHYQHDLDAMLRAIDETVSLVFVATPNNPTGTVIDPAELERFIERVPRHVLIVLDEAYREYLLPDQQPDATGWISKFSNLLVLRTFSKAYGLAGLRVGYAFGNPAIINVLQRLQSPFSINVLAQVAATAALRDRNFVEKTATQNRDEMAKMAAAFDAIGVEYIPSAGNFILARVGDAAAVYRALLQRGLIVRPVANYGLPEWLRISVGLPSENQALLEGLRAVLPAGRPRAG
jgi:histidinol-phosphate aminotransferase